MVGRGGVEPPTSRLSGVRSNHLSYRPLVLASRLRQRKALGSLLSYHHNLFPDHDDLQDEGT